MTGDEIPLHAATDRFPRVRVSALDTHEEFSRLRAKAAFSPILRANFTAYQFAKLNGRNGVP
jgi:hypothetical protein